MNKYRLMIILGATLISQLVLASSATTAHNDAAFQANIDAGEQIFSQVCAACHGKDLSGGAGFNLKDGEWIHGDSPEDILNSIKQHYLTFYVLNKAK